MNVEPAYDLVIVGGGLVGASLAIALADQGLRMAMLEAHPIGVDTQPNYDDRAIALAYGTRKVFEAIGVWDELAAVAEPIREIHVSDRGHFGFTRLSAAEEGVPALGYVVTAKALGAVLLGRLRGIAGLDLMAPARLVRFSDREEAVRVEIEHEGVVDELASRLLVAADGANSTVRAQLDLPLQRWEYGQSAVVANVSPAKGHRNVAYERFTDSGPVALLPMSEGRCALVWTVRDEQRDEVLALDDGGFLRAFQQRFGYRLGRFERVGRRHAYPLALLRARRSVQGRVAVIGNAAHTLHPIAGQGFNLGIRDVAALADVVFEATRDGVDIGAAATLSAYEDWRRAEQRGVALATDGLARLFGNPLGLLRLGRNLGMLALEFVPGARHPLARAAMGLAGRRPRLARGARLG
jgi:2-octaprenyl-6-methoxyphenol hydroxylase